MTRSLTVTNRLSLSDILHSLLFQPVAKFEANNTVTVFNDGDVELSTRSVDNAKVVVTAERMETTGEIFIKGDEEGVHPRA